MIGGRIQTDSYKGFLLDRGFQIYIDSYPQLQNNNIINSQQLDLVSFNPGAYIYYNNAFHIVSDPFRHVYICYHVYTSYEHVYMLIIVCNCSVYIAPFIVICVYTTPVLYMLDAELLTCMYDICVIVVCICITYICIDPFIFIYSF